MARRNKGDCGKNMETNRRKHSLKCNHQVLDSLQVCNLTVSVLHLISTPEVTLTSWLCHSLAV